MSHQSEHARIAVVTGASRGLGRGIATGLGEAGWAVYLTGRSGGDLAAATADVSRAGGHGTAVVCDHRDDVAVAEAFGNIAADGGRIDLLVNNATALPHLGELFSDAPFWESDPRLWDDFFSVGLRSHYIAARHAAPLMISQERGLIVNVSSAGAAARIGAVLPYGVAKAALDRMSADMAAELRPYGVSVVSVWPPPSATPGMLTETGGDPSTWSTPLFTGRVIAALADEDGLEGRSGQALRIAALAAELGVAADLYVP